MKQKLTNAAFVTAIVLIINILLYSIVYKRLLPYYWGSNEIADKREYLVRNKSTYNTIFIGSSKTHYQIIPKLFDEKAKENNLDIRSYNFGIDGLIPMESLYIYENLLLQDSLPLKYAFIELDWIGTVKFKNLNAIRSFYWLQTSNYSSNIHSLINSSVPLQIRGWGLLQNSFNYAENIINVGKIQEYIDFKKHADQQIFSKTDSNSIYNGFLPLTNKINSKDEHALFKEVVSSAKTGVANYSTLKNQKLSAPFLNRLKEIVSISKKKGITVYFVVPLQWKYYQYKELIPVINAIKEAKVICVFDIEKHKDIYSPDHFFDPNHLNYEGAKLYTELLFKLFKS